MVISKTNQQEALKILNALSDETRFKIVELLLDGDRSHHQA